MTVLASLPEGPTVVALGWTLVVSVWWTGLVALLVWGVIRATRSSSSSSRLRLAMGGLALSLAATLAVFVGLGRVAPPSAIIAPRPAQASGSTSAVSPDAAPPTAPTPEARQLFPRQTAIASLLPARLVAWGGLVWVTISAILAARALGGFVVVCRLRRRATPLRSPALRQAVESLALRMRLQRPVDLLESTTIDAPVALGWWRASLIFPLDFETSLDAELWEPIVAHELEHLRRRDPLFAAVQVAVDSLLCLSPGARWLSAEARATRELRCDDAAVAICGDAALYASALGALASLGCCDAAAPALGVSGVSLVERIRRILKGETMPRLSAVQVTGVALGLTALASSGPQLMGAALEQARNAAEQNAALASATSPAESKTPIPFSWSWVAGASPVRLASVEGTEAFVFDAIRVRNISEEPITSVTFLAVVEFFLSELRPSERPPVVIVESEPVIVSLAPGRAADLTIHFLSHQEALALQGKGRVRAHLAVASARRGDGTEWSFTPRRDARSVDEALFLKGTAFVTRSLIESTAPVAASRWTCSDDRGYESSFGAIVPILGEDRFARCTNGVWLDAGTLGRPSPDAGQGDRKPEPPKQR